MTRTRLGGVVVPMITPLTSVGEVDEESIERHTDRLIADGVHGLFVLGTTGEFPFLTDRQRLVAARAVVRAARGRVPVVVGVADTATPRVRDQIAAVADLPVDGVVVTAPFYAATSSAEILQHFRLIHRWFPELAVYAYENPPRVNGASLATHDMLTLAEEGAIQGLKDSSGADSHLRRHVLERQRRGLDDFVILTGSELTVDCAVLIGADGVVPGLGNVDAAGFVRVFEAARAGDFVTARTEQERLFRLFGIVGIATTEPMGGSSRALGAFKAAVHALGGIAERRTADPAIQLSEADVAAVVAVLRAAGLEPGRPGAAGANGRAATKLVPAP